MAAMYSAIRPLMQHVLFRRRPFLPGHTHSHTRKHTHTHACTGRLTPTSHEQRTQRTRTCCTPLVSLAVRARTACAAGAKTCPGARALVLSCPVRANHALARKLMSAPLSRASRALATTDGRGHRGRRALEPHPNRREAAAQTRGGRGGTVVGRARARGPGPADRARRGRLMRPRVRQSERAGNACRRSRTTARSEILHRDPRASRRRRATCLLCPGASYDEH